jgi:5-methyltetrahydropteroyltriglutamate--homocysteine methyltransferase
VTLPSPGLFANFWSPARSRGAYASLKSFLDDVARILREEVEELAEYGASYIQLHAALSLAARAHDARVL